MTEIALTLRPLTAVDLAEVVAIDRVLSGHGREDFFARRLAQATRAPAAFAAFAAARDDALAGFVLARIYDGEFGADRREAALDAIGIAGPPGQGIGRALLARLVAHLAAHGVRVLATEVDWTNPRLPPFFARNGFALAPRLVLARAGTPPAETEDAPARDRIPVRSMTPADFDAIAAIDRRITGRDRHRYLARKCAEAMEESAIRVSLVVESDGAPAGYVMARVDFGEFGHPEAEAVMDTIGVDPRRSHQGLARALLSQLLMNLAGLRVETLRTEVAWNQFGLLAFLDRMGFAPHRRLALIRPISRPS